MVCYLQPGIRLRDAAAGRRGRHAWGCDYRGRPVQQHGAGARPARLVG